MDVDFDTIPVIFKVLALCTNRE